MHLFSHNPYHLVKQTFQDGFTISYVRSSIHLPDGDDNRLDYENYITAMNTGIFVLIKSQNRLVKVADQLYE